MEKNKAWIDNPTKSKLCDEEQARHAIKRGLNGNLKFIPATTIGYVHRDTDTAKLETRSHQFVETMDDNLDQQEQNTQPRTTFPPSTVSALEDWVGTLTQQVAQEAAYSAVRPHITDNGGLQQRQGAIPEPLSEPQTQQKPQPKPRAKSPPPPVCEYCWFAISQKDPSDSLQMHKDVWRWSIKTRNGVYLYRN